MGSGSAKTALDGCALPFAAPAAKLVEQAEEAFDVDPEDLYWHRVALSRACACAHVWDKVVQVDCQTKNPAAGAKC